MLTKSITDIAKEVLKIEADSINRLIERFNEEEFNKAIDLMYNCKGRVIVTGMGKSGLVGKKIAATLSSTGTPSYFLHPAESTHGDSGMVTRDDVIVAISNSGETQELLNLLPFIKRFNLPLIAMCGNLNSTLTIASDVKIDISVEKEACPLGKAPTASTTATLAMGDAMAVCLLEKRGFTAEDFLIFHPSGSLGKGLLYKVSDLMRVDNLPIVNENEQFITTLETVDSHKLGLALIINDNNILTGILTDGDIRRTLLKHKDVEHLLVKDVMTKSPKTVEKSSYAAGALHTMEKYSITALPILDENSQPIGILHIHDLLKAGVA